MKKLKVNVKGKDKKYEIQIGENIIENIGDFFEFEKYSSVFIITDSNVEELYLEKVEDYLNLEYKNLNVHSMSFRAGEKSKNLQTVSKIYKEMVSARIDRSSLVLNLGGGVVSDLGGFVASTYLRGIDFINVTTTVEGIVDASIGGKTGVDFEDLKNYIGTFAQPKLVIMDLNTLDTLEQDVFISGFGEILKHGLIRDSKYFNYVGSKNPLKWKRSELAKIFMDSCKIKKDIVEEDEREKGVRKLLNFGHTVGHAIESLSLKTSKPLLHGQAVAIGIVAEAKISELMGYISGSEFTKIRETIESTALPVRYNGKVTFKEVFQLMQKDKKTEWGYVHWTLLKKIGEGDINIEVDLSFIKEGISSVILK